jgi:hypothetical protein
MSPLPKLFPAVIAGIALVLCGCVSEPLKPPSGKIGGISASQARIVLREEQHAKVASNVTWLLPAGDYRPAMEDKTGVYFEAPSKIFMQENFLGMNLPNKPFTGGIFLDRSDPKTAFIYMIIPANEGGEIFRMVKGGRPDKPQKPRQPIVFELKHS